MPFTSSNVVNGELSCQLYQWSTNMGLGVSLNTATYSLLTYMITHIMNLKPDNFVPTLGDAQTYLNHIKPLKMQLHLKSTLFSKLKILWKFETIDDFKAEDFQIERYIPHPTNKLEIAVSSASKEVV